MRPEEFLRPEEFFAAKVCVPSPRSSREWNLVPLEQREKTFFISGVTSIEILQVFRETIAEVIVGELSNAEGRRAIREGLAQLGYKPNDDAGTSNDLLSFERMNSVINMNCSAAHNFSSRQKQFLALRAYPAKRMTWAASTPMPQIWFGRWHRACVDLDDADPDTMTALLESSVWARLNRFGAPYGPYDFECKMVDLPVNATEAQRVIDKDIVEQYRINHS